MKIERIINGHRVEIELTPQEMYDAYFEQEHNFDMEDVRSMLDEDHWYYTDEAGDPAWPEMTDEQISDAASLAREWMDGNDHMAECRWDCISDAMKEVLGNE